MRKRFKINYYKIQTFKRIQHEDTSKDISEDSSEKRDSGHKDDAKTKGTAYLVAKSNWK